MSPHAAHSFLHYDGFAIAAPEGVSCYALRIMRSAKYVFTTSETGPNYAPRIYLEPQDGHAASNPYSVFLELRPGTTVAQSDALAQMLRSLVSEVSFFPK
jgi:hypothetical protein